MEFQVGSKLGPSWLQTFQTAQLEWQPASIMWRRLQLGAAANPFQPRISWVSWHPGNSRVQACCVSASLSNSQIRRQLLITVLCFPRIPKSSPFQTAPENPGMNSSPNADLSDFPMRSPIFQPQQLCTAAHQARKQQGQVQQCLPRSLISNEYMIIYMIIYDTMTPFHLYPSREIFLKWVCLKIVYPYINPMVLLIIIPMKNG